MAATAMKHMASNFAKLDKFEWVDFRRWQKKMHFLLSSMSVVYVMTTPIPKDGDDASVEKLRKRNKWNNDDYVCRDFKHTLKHKKDELTLIELGSHLRIEESLKAQDSDKLKGNNVVGPHDSILWHVRLGHVHFKWMQDMSKDGLIPAFDMDTKKCKTCMLAKITMKAFQNIKRETKVLELIHSDLCDLHATPLLGNKKYFMTFIDDASRAVVRLPDPKLKTLGERGIECIFVGYAEHSKAFRFFVIEPNDSVVINSIIESSDAIFDENRFSSVPRPSLGIPNGTEDIGGSVVPEEVVQQPEPELRTSKRNRNPKNFGPEFQLYLIEGTQDEVSDQHSYCFNVEENPKTFDEAMYVFLLVKKDEYEVWAMKMEYWITNNDMNIWKVIQNGNSLKRTRRDHDGRVIILPPMTADEHIAVQRESKARTTLLQSIPKRHFGLISIIWMMQRDILECSQTSFVKCRIQEDEKVYAEARIFRV
ncbi:zinc finger, CCHC-type containing protein [Tanacetum coccineum]